MSNVAESSKEDLGRVVPRKEAEAVPFDDPLPWYFGSDHPQGVQFATEEIENQIAIENDEPLPFADGDETEETEED
jgi:hypothetical protein